MDRRNIMLAFTGAAVAPFVRSTVASAQTTAAASLDPTDYTAETLQIGTLSKTISQLALEISANPLVRRFAKLEIDEQTAVAESLTADANPSPAPLNDQQQAMVQSLQGMSGSGFDKAYVQAQISGHQQLAAIQSEFLANDTDLTADLVHVALIATAFIETHLSILHALVPIVAIAG